MIILKFETLYPIHISNGNELSYNIEYIIKDDTFCRLDLNYASRVMADNNLFDFSKNYNFNTVIRTIEDNLHLFNKDSFQYSLNYESSFLQQIKNENAVGKKIVQEFVNSNGNFYVPASSIKGALLTVLNQESLGIKSRNPKIEQKFVLSDSNYIAPENFLVDRTSDRPPAINLITMDAGTKFELNIRKKGELNLDILKDKLSKYSYNQIEKAKHFVGNYKSKIPDKPNGADKYFEMLNQVADEDLSSDEYLINIGFGGGSYFKLSENAEIPKFKSKKFRQDEEAHTTFAIEIENRYYQLGWCKLKIEEE